MNQLGKHIVNYGLLLSFLTLSVTGVFSFILPFDLPTARIHSIFGILTIILVGAHLATRISYFKNTLKNSIKKKKKSVRLSHLVTIFTLWIGLLVICFYDIQPIRGIMNQSYEAKHRATIVRQSPMAGFVELTDHESIIARMPREGADLAVSMMIRSHQSNSPPPAMVIWAETKTGTMIETLYIDPRLAYEREPEWGGKKTLRHHILPIWRHKYSLLSGIDPDGEVDAHSVATPKHSFSLDDYLVVGKEKAFNLCLEINIPKDPNSAYPDTHLGQPSLLYDTHISVDDETPYHILELVGHGSEAIKDGMINFDLDEITSARKLLDIALVKIEKVEKKREEMKLFSAIIIFLLGIVGLGINGSHSAPSLQVITGESMGTTFRIKVYAEHLPKGLTNEIQQQFDTIERDLSHWSPDAWVSQFNASESTEFQEAPEHLVRLLKISKELHRKTQGKFDPSIGALVNLWGFGPNKALNNRPSQEEIEEALNHSGFSKIEFSGNKLRKLVPELQLDFSAIAKGYTVDQITDFLFTHGIDSFLVDFGGEIYAASPPPERASWTVKSTKGLQKLENMAVATSGATHQRKGEYCHIIDPRTGMASTVNKSFSVLAKSCAEADALATASMLE